MHTFFIVLTNTKKKRETHFKFLSWLVESPIQFSNSFIQDLLQVYEFAEKNSSRF